MALVLDDDNPEEVVGLEGTEDSEGTDDTVSRLGRVNKSEFVKLVARRAGVTVRAASTVYDAVIEEILEIAGNGDSLTLTGFGKFYPQRHGGHRVQYSDDEGVSEVPDYAVLKFSATRSVNRLVKVPAFQEKASKRKKNEPKENDSAE